MISLIQILSEIKIGGPLKTPIDIVSIENDEFEDDEYEYVDEYKVGPIIHKYLKYIKDLEYKNLDKLIETYCEGINDWGEIELYKNMTIKDLLEDFKLFIQNEKTDE